MAQTGDTELTTRDDQIQAQRMEKAADVRSGETTAIEETFRRIGSLMRRAPIRIRVGGLGPGAGLAIGSVLEWRNSSDQIVSRIWGTGSLHGFYGAGAGVELRNLTVHDLTF